MPKHHAYQTDRRISKAERRHVRSAVRDILKTMSWFDNPIRVIRMGFVKRTGKLGLYIFRTAPKPLILFDMHNIRRAIIKEMQRRTRYNTFNWVASEVIQMTIYHELCHAKQDLDGRLCMKPSDAAYHAKLEREAEHFADRVYNFSEHEHLNWGIAS